MQDVCILHFVSGILFQVFCFELKYPGVLDGHEGRMPKSCCPIHCRPYTPYLAEV